jgi:para-aminobenzoate synthetase / 4-amino-4-deoxychorismate lyase
MPQSPVAAIYSGTPDTWLFFENPVKVLFACSIHDVLPIIAQAEQAALQGKFAVGFVSYEAGPAFDSAMPMRECGTFPQAWFGIFNEPRRGNLPRCGGSPQVPQWLPDITESHYFDTIRRIKDYIAGGDTYQVNFSFRMHADFSGDPWHYFCRVAGEQPPPFAAFVDIGEYAVCSFSPELFFERSDKVVTGKPMKGTSARGRFSREDAEIAARLEASAKDRAENVMIVDMIRNDIGRVARQGSMAVSNMFAVEKFPTVFQMTSTVSAITDVSTTDIFRCLFPCASVTGAPKIRTMQIINELEQSPRRVYCGALGYMAPCKYARFGVAIRTMVLDRKKAAAEYSVGSGVLWESDAQGEYQECLDKAVVVTMPVPEFFLVETMRWDPAEGFFLPDMHIARLLDSADYFGGFSVNEALVRSYLDDHKAEFKEHPCRVRIVCGKTGLSHSISPLPLQRNGRPVRLGISQIPVDSRNRFLFHKTSLRDLYDRAVQSRADADDIILVNEQGEATETAIANLVFEINGKRITPKLECGLLPGVFRRYLLEKGEIKEGVVRIDDVRTCPKIWRINSVRKWEECELIDRNA